MTASLVHELASVVQTLQGALYELEDFIREAAAGDPEILDALDEASETSRRILTLFRAMRGFVRGGDLNHRPCQISDLIDRAATLCCGYLRGRARLTMTAIPDVMIEVSEPLFLQVLVNLIKNAADASPHDGEISLFVAAASGTITFEVSDDGPGVPPEIADSLFEPFVTTKGEHSGSGLGLAISAQIVADHGGTISYARAPGRGAKFTVIMPISDPSLPVR